ncbi:MAG: hypothetical protein QOG90_235, partial [Actinomycetota bacterium]
MDEQDPWFESRWNMPVEALLRASRGTGIDSRDRAN